MIQLNFENGFPNESLSVGDLVFYISNPNSNIEGSGFVSGDSDGGSESSAQSSMVYIGNVVSIDTDSAPESFSIYVNNLTSVTSPISGDFVLFAKNSRSSSDLLGYYNKVTFKNNSASPAELFAISCNYTQSSK